MTYRATGVPAAYDPKQTQREQYVDAQMSTPKIGANVVSQFVPIPNVATKGVDVSFGLTSVTGIKSVSLVRAKVMDIKQSIVLQTWTAKVAKFTWSDTDVLLQQYGEAFYWLKLEPVNPTGTEVDVGPQLILLNPSLLPPLPITSISASHAAAVNGTVLVTVNVSGIPSGDSIKIYVTGYETNPSPVAVAQRTSAPLQFTLQATGETVTFTAIAVSPGGAEAPSGPTTTLVLNGTATVPAQIQGVLVTQISTGNQVSWPSSLEAGVTSYLLNRGNRGTGYGSSSLLATITATTVGTVIYLDTGGLGGDYEYFVVAVTAGGNSPPSVAANPQILFSSAQIPTNVPANATNTGIVDSIDAGASATIRIYGPGGVGTAYNRQAGYGNPSRPAGSITGLAYSTRYYIILQAGVYLASTSYFATLPDGSEWVATLVTCPVGGFGGATCAVTVQTVFPYSITNVYPTAIGNGYGDASVTINTTSGGGADVRPNIVNGQVTSYTIINAGGGFTTGATGTVNLLAPYSGGGAQGGSRYVPTS